MGDSPMSSRTGQREHWGSRLGVILAVAGSAVGLGNFLRFPGVAANHGGGAFMIPYLVSFLLLGIPICWCEWSMGRLGGRFGQNNGPGILFALWRRAPAKGIGALTLFIPVVVYTYYVVVEAWCLGYAIEFFRGGFASMFIEAQTGIAEGGDVSAVIVGRSGEYFAETTGQGAHGDMFLGNVVWLVLTCFAVNFFIIYRGVTRGIETFCKVAMPLLIACALVILVRVLTLDGISSGLGFMWNPDWSALRNPSVWLAAAGQIFFTLSVGFGLILCYSSYLRPNDDVVLTSLSASSTNEFCEVVLGGMIVVPTAFLFLGAEAAKGSTFGLGFVTIPAIMHFMPGGDFFGGMWFGLLFLAAVTSSLSMLQPAIAFLEDAFGMRRAWSVLVLSLVTALGALPSMYFTRGLVGLDNTDFWANLMMIVAATGQVILIGWVVGAERACREANRGADFPLPSFMPFMLRYITPTFLIIVLVTWAWTKAPGYIEGMSPASKGAQAERAVYEAAIGARFARQSHNNDDLAKRVTDVLGTKGVPKSLPDWLVEHQAKAHEARRKASTDANVARFVFIGLVVFYVMLLALSDIACRNRIGRTIEEAEKAGVRLE